jgi:hypothetical protein
MTFHEGPVDLQALQGSQKAAPAAPNLVLPQVILVSRERLEAPSQRVTVTNSSPVQTHIVIDRFMNGHELLPRQKKEIEMLVDESAEFRKLGRPNRGVYPAGPLAGQPLPAHPLRFVDLPDPQCRAAPQPGRP